MPANNAQNAATLNMQARQLIKLMSIKRIQSIANINYDPTKNNRQIINPQNVGLIRGFWVQVTHTVSNGSAVDIDLTQFGPANALSMIQFDDLNNVTRIQTPGWHLHLVNSCKARRPFGAALEHTATDSPIDYGANWINQISAPAQIAAGGVGTVIMRYWVPLVYGGDDLRGGVYANVVNSTMRLFFDAPGSNGVVTAVTQGSDDTLAMYVGHAAGSVALVTITNTNLLVYQEYLDQLPVNNGQVILPVIDLATIYELKQTSQTGIVAGQDFNYQYANFRDFLSTIVVYNHDPSVQDGRGVGADINYWALQSANASNVWKMDPGLIAHMNRNFMQTDFPPGVYYFGTREKPINTQQYGNMQLVLNAITAQPNAYQLVGVEDFALQQTLSMAGSLASGG